MITLFLTLAVGFDPGVSVVADTPEAAVRRAAELDAGRDRSPIIPARAFDGLPRPGPGIEFRAAVDARGTSDGRLRVRVGATRNGRVVVRRGYLFSWRSKLAVVVPTADLLPGAVIGRGALTLKEIEASGNGEGLALAPEQLIGRVAKARLTKGRPIRLTHVVLPRVVERGQQITVEATFGEMKVRMKGIALAQGAVGDTIRVRNLHTKKQVEAQIVSFGVAEVIR